MLVIRSFVLACSGTAPKVSRWHRMVGSSVTSGPFRPGKLSGQVGTGSSLIEKWGGVKLARQGRRFRAESEAGRYAAGGVSGEADREGPGMRAGTGV